MSNDRFSECKIHSTALIEHGVNIGPGTSVWDNVHIRHGANIGKNCIIGEKTYIAYDVKIGDYCKLNASVYVCAAVTISDYVMLAAHTVFTNDRFPRAFHITCDGLASSEPNEETLETVVGVGVTTGANATIGPGLRIGDFAMVGMGSVVTRTVPPHSLVVGNPARIVAYVCTCGPAFLRHDDWAKAKDGSQFRCGRCERVFEKHKESVRELHGPTNVQHRN